MSDKMKLEHSLKIKQVTADKFICGRHSFFAFLYFSILINISIFYHIFNVKSYVCLHSVSGILVNEYCSIVFLVAFVNLCH